METTPRSQKPTLLNAQEAWTWQERRAAGALGWIVVILVGMPSLGVALISAIFNAEFSWSIGGGWQEKIAWAAASLALSCLVIGIPIARPYLRERRPEVARWSLWLWVGLLIFSCFGAVAFLSTSQSRPPVPVHVEQPAPMPTPPLDEIRELEAELSKAVGDGLPARVNCEMGQARECHNPTERARILEKIKRAAALETKLFALEKAKQRGELAPLPPPAPASAPKRIEAPAPETLSAAIVQKLLSIFVATLIEAASAIGLWIAAESYVGIVHRKRFYVTTGGTMDTIEDDPAFERSSNLSPLTQTEGKAVEWLWPQVVPLGKLTLLGGLPGLGKSQITIAIAATLSKGESWPAGSGRAQRGATLLLVSEDDIADTVKPRLQAAGADNRYVYATDGAFDLAEDLERLKQLAREISNLRLIVFDPISRYISGRSPAKTRAALDAYNLWAARNRIASIGIRHPPKGKQANAQNLFSGSAEEIRIARGAWIALPDPQIANRGLLLLAKSNHIADKRGFAYRIQGVTLSSGIETSRIVWEHARVDGTADDYLAGAFGNIRPRRQQRAQCAPAPGGGPKLRIVR